MGIAEVEHVGARGVNEYGGQRIEPLAPSDHGRLAAGGESRERGKRGLDGGVAAARQRHGEEIHQRSLGLVGHRGRQRLAGRAHRPSGQDFSYGLILPHPHPLAFY